MEEQKRAPTPLSACLFPQLLGKDLSTQKFRSRNQCGRGGRRDALSLASLHSQPKAPCYPRLTNFAKLEHYKVFPPQLLPLIEGKLRSNSLRVAQGYWQRQAPSPNPVIFSSCSGSAPPTEERSGQAKGAQRTPPVLARLGWMFTPRNPGRTEASAPLRSLETQRSCEGQMSSPHVLSLEQPLRLSSASTPCTLPAPRGAVRHHAKGLARN